MTPLSNYLKIIFDRVEGLQPWGLLLGDESDRQQPPPLIIDAEIEKA